MPPKGDGAASKQVLDLPLESVARSAPEKDHERPSLQLALTEAELEEEIPMILTAKNPVAPENVVRYNPNVKAFKAEAIIQHTIVHYATNGWLVSPGSDEANAQLEHEKAEHEAKQEYERVQAKKKQEAAHEGVVELKNVFNFAERAMQTKNLPQRERFVQTDPPPVETASGESSFSIIYDTYLADQTRIHLQEKAQRELRGKGKKGQKKQDAEEVDLELEAEEKDDPEVMESNEMKHAMKLMGRMISQNMFNHLILDYKYWEDQSDQFRQGEGTLLPLWHDPSFRNPSVKRKHVTALCWNPKYADLFAVGYGSFDFHRQGKGDVCIFSLKNPTEPEAVFECDSGAMCLDFHSNFPNLLAVGLYDGSVLVFDIASGSKKPLYQSNVRVGKHTDPVWQIRWQEDEMSKSLQFYSVSTDGRVAMWSVTKAEVEMSVAMELRLMSTRAEEEEEDEDAMINALAGGCCFDFNQAQGHLFVVGTEEGLIHKCSKAYNSQYLDTYNAHQMPVYAVRWNHLHPRVFLSASADWSVKLWDHTSSERPFLSFDLGSPVGDAVWAPYSSTVFAAVTADGKVHVFDLAQNKNEPICEQKMPSKKAKLTRIAFNPKQPVVLVGDEKGRVTLLKLSPNLRRSSAPVEGKTLQELEEAKMDRIIQIAEKSLRQALKAEKMNAKGAENGA